MAVEQQQAEDWNFYWSIAGGNLTMAVTAKVNFGWIGFGFSSSLDGQMVGSVVAIGWSSTTDSTNHFIGDYTLNAQSSAGVTIGNQQQLSSTDVWSDPNSGSTTIIFTRPLIVTGVPSINPTGKTTVVFAGGPRPGSAPANPSVGGGAVLSQHTTGHGVGYSMQIDFNTGAASATETPPAKVAHAAMMWLAWGVCLPSGILWARYGKAHSIWWNFHRGLQITGIVLAVIGWVIGVFVIGSGTFVSHFYIGTIAVAVAVAQPFNAFIRPHIEKGEPPSLYRRIWFFFHSNLGRSALILALANMLIGVFMVLQPAMIYQILIVISVAIIILAFIVLEIRKRCTDSPQQTMKRLHTNESEIELDAAQ